MSAPVSVQVRYFAILRERTGREAEAFELPAGATVREARAAIAARHPEIVPLLSRIAIAVNRAVVAESHPLSPGDEVALLPPVSGGSGYAPAPAGLPCTSTVAGWTRIGLRLMPRITTWSQTRQARTRNSITRKQLSGRPVEVSR